MKKDSEHSFKKAPKHNRLLASLVGSMTTFPVLYEQVSVYPTLLFKTHPPNS